MKGRTRLSGKGVNGGLPIPAEIAYPLKMVSSTNENMFIVATIDDWNLQMVKIRVIGEAQFEWMEAKYYKMSRYTTRCTYYDPNQPASQLSQVFGVHCFEGTAVSDPDYLNVELVSEVESGTSSFYLKECNVLW